MGKKKQAENKKGSASLSIVEQLRREGACLASRMSLTLEDVHTRNPKVGGGIGVRVSFKGYEQLICLTDGTLTSMKRELSEKLPAAQKRLMHCTA